eukprot:CAMPEP_0194576880 /NCGR_PEP_ID=MMETSP0292-20121207/11853_1 /TAXON_ID=39354 /ORGANISM="Heterosigma akashiwo, Strain CCMP2393" /LENGTH=67 /DNA_ID=CAMNT_0039429087 /DNA_START=75 /DNA_END=275 /DNA_ORIENTATION=+
MEPSDDNADGWVVDPHTFSVLVKMRHRGSLVLQLGKMYITVLVKPRSPGSDASADTISGVKKWFLQW